MTEAPRVLHFSAFIVAVFKPAISLQRFRVIHILSSPSPSWEGETGKLSYPLLKKYLPQPTVKSDFGDINVCVCGPLLFARAIYE